MKAAGALRHPRTGPLTHLAAVKATKAEGLRAEVARVKVRLHYAKEFWLCGGFESFL